ncbi:hypothetical protein VKA11_20770 [Bacillus paranthracis]|uniref:hypothetical protein n=1 Tax=Bacillus paranthracis TaxID=2026186 RepID=UPI0026CA46DA
MLTTTTETTQEFTFQDFWNELEKDYKDMIKPNILIAGKTGVVFFLDERERTFM